jgi:hypothetical protein
MERRTVLQFLIVALLMSATAWPASLNAQCLYYGDVSLTGRLVQQTYPGPPDFESVTKGDAPLVIWILQLDTGVCIVSSDPSYPNVYNEREIQLVLGTDQYARTNRYAEYRHLLGKKIAVTGRLQPGGGKYEKPQVLALRSIKELF